MRICVNNGTPVIVMVNSLIRVELLRKILTPTASLENNVTLLTFLRNSVTRRALPVNSVQWRYLFDNITPSYFEKPNVNMKSNSIKILVHKNQYLNSRKMFCNRDSLR